MVSIPKTSFASGEVSPALHGRFDISRYDSALATARNVFVRPHGGISNRPGTEFVAEVADSTRAARLIPFTFNDADTYVLELGDKTLRVHRNGGTVVEPDKVITGATQSNPATITSAAHGFSNGDEVFVSGIQGMTELNGRSLLVTGATGTTFALTDKAGQNVDATAYGTYTGDGTASRVHQITTPWGGEDLQGLRYAQSADVMYVVHPAYPPQKISRSDHDDWSVSPITFTPGVAAPVGVNVSASGLVQWAPGKVVHAGEPKQSGARMYLSASSGTTGPTAPTHTAGTETDGGIDWTFQDDITTYEYKVTAVSTATGEEGLPSAIAPADNDLVTNGARNTVSWDAVAGASHYIVYREDNGVYGRVGSTEALTFTDQNITPDISDSHPVANNPFPGVDDYPGCVTIYEQRLVFAGTNNRPRSIFMSAIGAFENFSTRNPFQDDDAVTITIASSRMNRVRHMIDAGGDLLALTSGSEWTIKRGTNADAVTPTSVRLEAESNFGAGKAAPLVIGKSLIFPESKGKTVRSLGYEFASDGYNGQDISILSDHLFDGRSIVEWCYAQSPDGVVWTLLDDGQCLALTLKKEHDINGWTRIETDGEIESVCSVDEGRSDATYFLVRRTINGRDARMIERMPDRHFNDIADGHFVDCGLTHDGTVLGEPPESWVRLQSLQNLQHLEGATLTALADGHVVADLVVTDGRVDLPFAALKIHIGLPYSAEIETLPMEFQTDDGSQMGKRKRIRSPILRVRDTRGIKFGAPGTDFVAFHAQAAEGWTDPVQGYTGTIDQEIAPIWNRDGSLIIRQDDPLPMTILSLSLDVEAGE